MNNVMISKAISRLLTQGQGDLAYGLMMLKSGRRKDTSIPSWVGVTFDHNGKPWLLYNPEFPGAPTEEDPGWIDEVMNVLKHEAHHLFLLHPIRGAQARLEGRAMHRLALIWAMEHTANEGIAHLLSECIYYPELKGYTTQEVYEELIKRAQQYCDQGSGQDESDSSSAGGESSSTGDPQEGSSDQKQKQGSRGDRDDEREEGDGSGSLLDQHARQLAELDRAQKTIEELLKQGGGDIIPAEGGAGDRAKQLVIQVLQEAMQKSRGTLPGPLSDILEKLVDKRLPLQQAFRKMLQRLAFQSRSKWNFTRKRFSRRYPEYPGKIKVSGEGLGIALDSSGSMSDLELSILMAEVDRAAKKYGVYLIGADAKVYAHRRYRPGDWKKFKMARGGTDFQPAVDLAVEMGMKKLVYFTDMVAPPPDPKGLDILWVCTDKSHNSDYVKQGFPGEIFYVADYIVEEG